MFIMMGSNDKNIPGKAETIIGPTINIKGDFVGEGDIIIEGKLEGNLKTNAYIYIGDNAIINANISAEKGRIGGTITGNIRINGHLNVVSSAQINGDIYCKTISIETGAIFNGKCKMGKNVELPSKQDLTK